MLTVLWLLSWIAQAAPAASTNVHVANNAAASNLPTTMPRLHDPSTIVRDGPRYYIYSTGRGVPFFSSPDARTWTREGSVFTALPASVVAAAPGNNGLDAWAPDILKVGSSYYLYYAVSKWGSFASSIGLATNTTLDPSRPDYHWVDRGVVVHSDGREEMNDIDPGVTLAPDGTLWLCFGSYHGSIELIQLEPTTGQRIAPASPVSVIAVESEASDIIAHAGYFFLFVNHGSCCQGASSTYHISVGRAKTITGPYLDKSGHPLTSVPGEPFLKTEGDHIGPGHFGLVRDDSNSPERFSVHYESDPSNGGKPALAIHTLLWSADGWPVAGPALE